MSSDSSTRVCWPVPDPSSASMAARFASGSTTASIAPAGRSSATLVMIDNPRDLTWRGRSNLYGNIGVYMAYSGKGERQEPIVDYPRWKETATELRETGTMVATTSVWDAADPSQALATETDNPTRVFLLNSSIASRTDVGGAPRPVRVDPQEREDRPAVPTRR